MPDSLFFQTIAAEAPRPLLSKKRATAEEIQADLRERIERASRRDPRLEGCATSRPRRIGVKAEGAPNWTVDGFPGLAPGCFTALVAIVDQARFEYDLEA
jgi:hypothetical protein